jgi:hypothetical protein
VIDALAGSAVIATAFLTVRTWMWARPRLAPQRIHR